MKIMIILFDFWLIIIILMFSMKLCNIKFVINLKQYVSVLMVTFGKVSSSMLLDLSV
jgi:hypothetical protein